MITTSEVAFGTNEARVREWRSGTLTYRFAVLRKGDPRNPGTEVTNRYATVFTTALKPDMQP